MTRLLKIIIEHVKKLSGLTIVENKELMINNKAKEEIEKRSGNFADSLLTNKATITSIQYLILVYYSAKPFENQISSGGVKKVSYGCRSNLYVQIVNAANNQILNSKHYYGSVGTEIMGTDNYQSKEAAVKASANNSSTDFNDDTKSIDDYFKKTIFL